MKNKLLRLIKMAPGEASEPLFNELALLLYKHQYRNNAPYRQFSDSQDKNPENVKVWEAIPAIPVMAFKYQALSCRPIHEAQRLFYSSGTTQEEKSCHPLFDTEISREAILGHFKRHILPDKDRIRFMILTPSPQEAPNTSFSHMMEVVREAFGEKESAYYIHQGQLQSERIIREMAVSSEALCLIGTSFSFVHFIDFCHEKKWSCSLPPGSRLMDTGGFKGSSREVPQEWIYTMARQCWDIPNENCINEYGMTEMTSQFYDRIAGESTPRLFRPPPQVRTRLLSPESLKPVPEGEVGLLAHTDLANLDSVSALLTEDLGREVDGGFALLGRAGGSGQKGCSITIDELLQRNITFQE
ncbi:MAG: long-chain fatty acid--CoA ligase [Nitrospiria bacterium]